MNFSSTTKIALTVFKNSKETLILFPRQLLGSQLLQLLHQQAQSHHFHTFANRVAFVARIHQQTFGGLQVFECAIHIDIVDEQIVIQWNDTEELLDETLMEMGVPKTAICLGTIPPEFRAATLPEESSLYQKAA